MTAPIAVTWRDVAQAYPEFVQWVVQRHGGVPDGRVQEADYQRLAAEYAAEREAAR